MPGKEFGLPPLWATVNAIQKCMILKIDKDIIYTLSLRNFLLTVNTFNHQSKEVSTSPRIFVCYAIVSYQFHSKIQL